MTQNLILKFPEIFGKFWKYDNVSQKPRNPILNFSEIWRNLRLF